jgi:hypothetical protein
MTLGKVGGGAAAAEKIDRGYLDVSILHPVKCRVLHFFLSLQYPNNNLEITFIFLCPSSTQ